MSATTAPAVLPSPAVSPYFTVRFAKWLGRWRFIWSRKMIYTLAGLAVLAAGFYQYENAHGRQELAAARAEMKARLAVAAVPDLLPAIVPAEQNFYALPAIQSWRGPTRPDGTFILTFPAATLFPDGPVLPPVQNLEGLSRLDLPAWAAARQKQGASVPPDTTPLAALNEELELGRPLLDALAAGLDRPFSQYIPSRRAALDAANGDTILAYPPSFQRVFHFQERLALHLRAAALQGQADRIRPLAGILLQLAHGLATEPEANLHASGQAMLEITFPALNEALACPGLTDAALADIQQRLASTDDLRNAERYLLHATQSTDLTFDLLKHAAQAGLARRYLGTPTEPMAHFWSAVLLNGPRGWLDTNAAFGIRQHLAACGPGGGNWQAAEEAIGHLSETTAACHTLYQSGDFWIPNSRYVLGVRTIPQVTGLWSKAARLQFQRHAALLTCALRRHQILHQSFPATLTALDATLLPAPPPNITYRPTAEGFILIPKNTTLDWTWQYQPPAA